MIVWWGLAWVSVIGCNKMAPNGGVYRVRIPLDDHTGHYSLQTVELHTVKDIRAMAGSTATFLADGKFNVFAGKNGGEQAASANFGSTPSAEFIDVGGVLHPADFRSMAMAASMYHFESIKNFYDRFRGNENLKFPRLILFNVGVVHNFGVGEVELVNNAAFVPSLDLFWINPYKNADVPLAFNGGALAHEYLHSVFNVKFHAAEMANLEAGRITALQARRAEQSVAELWSSNEWLPNFPSFNGFPPPPDDGDLELGKNDLIKINRFIYGSLNEGIADYYGYEYSRNPGWLTPSLPTQAFRDLSVAKDFSWNVAGQKRLIMQSFSVDGAQTHLDVHWAGAYFSHMLYLVSQQWGSVDTEKAAFNFMGRYADKYTTDHEKRFISMGELVRLFFMDRSPADPLCQKIKAIFSGELNDGNFLCAFSGGTVWR